MPTARELLEQADALMRRNRTRTGNTQPAEADIPVLTEAVDAALPAVDDTADMPSQPEPYQDEESVAQDAGGVETRTPVLALDDVPVLTDVVEEIEAPSIAELPDALDEPSQWLDADRGETSITGPLPDSIVVVPPAIAEAERESPLERAEPSTEQADDSHAEIDITAPADYGVDQSSEASDVDELALDALEASDVDELEQLEAPASAAAQPPSASAVVASALALVAHHEPPAVATIPVDDDERWDSIAEEIRMQVLQRIDIFTDTGLRERLTARLQPIVDRASADLVATINQHVGQLLRTYVAEAIEREIEKWRQGGG